MAKKIKMERAGLFAGEVRAEGDEVEVKDAYQADQGPDPLPAYRVPGGGLTHQVGDADTGVVVEKAAAGTPAAEAEDQEAPKKASKASKSAKE